MSGDDVVAAGPPLREVLGVSPTADPSEIETAFCRLVKTAHPDTGGSDKEVQRIYDARDEMLDGT